MKRHESVTRRQVLKSGVGLAAGAVATPYMLTHPARGGPDTHPDVLGRRVPPHDRALVAQHVVDGFNFQHRARRRIEDAAAGDGRGCRRLARSTRSSIPGFMTVKVTGNRLPYAPEHLIAGTVGVRTGFGLDVELEGVYTSSAYTDDLNTVDIVANGQRGEIPGYTVWNLAANYGLDACDCKLFVTAKNLTDKLYIADMSRGLIPGMPRLVQAGFEFKF